MFANVGNDPPYLLFHAGKIRGATLFQRADKGLCFAPTQSAHYSTTLFRGYSTIPSALAALSWGMIFHAVDSSMIVFTATHSPSLKFEIVGFCSAGSTDKTPDKSCLRTLSINPTRP